MGTPGRPPSPRPPAVVAVLKEYAAAFAARERELAAEHERLIAERDDAIRDAAANGLTLDAISEILSACGVSASRATVQRIVSRRT